MFRSNVVQIRTRLGTRTKHQTLFSEHRTLFDETLLVDYRLRFRPGLDAVLANADASSRCALVSTTAACSVGISPDRDLQMLVLHRELPS